MILQTPARAPKPLPLLGFTQDHLAIVLGGIPIALSVTKLLLVSQGDDATFLALIQNLNVLTILVFSVVTSLPFVVPVLGVLIATKWDARLLPNMRPTQRRALVSLCFMWTLWLVALISWSLAVFCVAAAVGISGLGLLANRISRRGGRPSRRALTEPVLLVVVAVLSLAVMGPWLPSERITLSDGSVRTGYLIAAGDPMTVLWGAGGVAFLKVTDVRDRQICGHNQGMSSGILLVGRDKTPQCAKDKAPTVKR